MRDQLQVVGLDEDSAFALDEVTPGLLQRELALRDELRGRVKIVPP
jgi:hypothetical protein